MVRRMLRIAAYVRAPVKTFVMLHPLKALKWGVMYLVVKKALEMERKPV